MNNVSTRSDDKVAAHNPYAATFCSKVAANRL